MDVKGRAATAVRGWTAGRKWTGEEVEGGGRQARQYAESKTGGEGGNGDR